MEQDINIVLLFKNIWLLLVIFVCGILTIPSLLIWLFCKPNPEGEGYFFCWRPIIIEQENYNFSFHWLSWVLRKENPITRSYCFREIPN